MTRTIIFIFTFLLLFPPLLPAKEAELRKIRKLATKTSLQLYLHFDELPKYSDLIKGKRIDIILKTNLKNTEPTPFETDERVVKFLTQESEDGTILSFFMRYKPQKVSFSTEDNRVIIVDVLLGNQFTMTYPDLSARLEGISVFDQEKKDFNDPAVVSPYAGNWRSFFTRYEPDIHTEVPIQYTTPPFPLASFLSDEFQANSLPKALFELSAEERWREMVSVILEEINKPNPPISSKHLTLTLGETLFRAEKYDEAFTQLFLVQNNYPGEPVATAAAYLLALMEAKQGNSHRADHQLGQLADKINPNFALSPFLLLSQIETSLATQQYQQAEVLLQRDDIAYPPRLNEIKTLRQVDYWHATGNMVKSYAGYSLFENRSTLESQPYSLNGYCTALYHQKKFVEAAQCYDTLSTMVADKKYLSTVSLKKAMAELRFKPSKEMYVTFSSIENTYIDTPAGQRAALKKNDVRYLTQPRFRKSSVTSYNRIAREATARDVAEEAALKEAIINYELGNTRQSLDQLMAFRRNFHRSDLKTSAQALIIEQLPAQLKEYLEEENYVDVIVLAKQNRKFFINDWLDSDLLGLLATAYNELGIYSEARKIYLFLLNNSGKEEQQQYYLPLLTILHSQGYHDLVEDYSIKYNYNYPESPEKEAVTLIRLKSLIVSREYEKAIKLVENSRIQSQEFEETAARLYFNTDDYAKVSTLLLPYHEDGLLHSADLLFMLAESYYQTGDMAAAEPLFEVIQDDPTFFDHSRYRCALIARENGDTEKSLKLLKKIVEEGNSTLWQRLAQKDLDFYELALQ